MKKEQRKKTKRIKGEKVKGPGSKGVKSERSRKQGPPLTEPQNLGHARKKCETDW